MEKVTVKVVDITHSRCQKAIAYVTITTVILGHVSEQTVTCGSRAVAIRDTKERPALVLRLLAVTTFANLHPFIVCAL
jgi:hypothetical protein